MSPKVLFSKDQIQKRITKLGQRIASDYQDKKLVVIGVLSGSYIFMADLTRNMWEAGLTDFQVDFIGVSSYGNSKESNKKPQFTKQPKISLTNRHVLLVEDIYDTGHTLHFVLEELAKQNPASLKVSSFLSKPARHEVDIALDYLGFEIDDVWVEGYGLDSAEIGRANPNIIVKA